MQEKWPKEHLRGKGVSIPPFPLKIPFSHKRPNEGGFGPLLWISPPGTHLAPWGRLLRGRQPTDVNRFWYPPVGDHILWLDGAHEVSATRQHCTPQREVIQKGRAEALPFGRLKEGWFFKEGGDIEIPSLLEWLFGHFLSIQKVTDNGKRKDGLSTA